MKLKSILYLLIALPLLWSCNNEDNIEDIFSSGTWYLINFYGGGLDDAGTPEFTPNFYGGGLDDAGTPEFTPKDDNATLEVIQKFTIVFNNDNTFKASAQNITFEGIWEANGKDRSVSINIEDRRNSTNLSNKFMDALVNARFYKGDSNYLRLAPEDKKSFIQLRHN